MGVKDELREIVEHMSDAEAEAWLRELRMARKAPAGGHRKLIDEVIASLPRETFENWPPSSAIDEVVYGG